MKGGGVDQLHNCACRIKENNRERGGTEGGREGGIIKGGREGGREK